MKNKLPDDSIFRKKSFFVALYSCVGVVVILAAVISYININQTQPKTGQTQNINAQLSQANAGQNSPNPALAGQPSPNPALSGIAGQNPSASSQLGGSALIAQAQADVNKQQAQAPQQLQGAVAKAKPTTAPAAPAPQTPKATSAPAPTAAAKPGKSASSDKSLAEPVFNSYKDGDTMDWPLLGDIVLDYSKNRLVYDKTLDQYRTNSNIWIAATKGAPVKAANDGVVQKIVKTRTDGTTITIDNGNGWTTTYGQLLDSVLVKEGDVVKRGQIIGGVADPTIYGVLQGPHLSFTVAKDDVTVDPKTVLKSENAESAAPAIK